MFHRVVVNVVHMPTEVVLVLDGVFPVALLPEQVFAARCFVELDALSEQAARKECFDTAPSCRVIGISGRKRPQGVEVFRQNNNGLGLKRAALRGLPHGVA